MSDSLIAYNSAAVPGDTNNTAGAYVKRGSDKSINVGQVNGTIAAFQSMLLGVSASITGAATATAGYTLVLCDATSGAFNLTLPPIASSVGQVYLIAKTDSSGNAVTVKGNASENLVTPGVGAGANTYAGLSAQGKILLIINDGTVWRGGQLAA
jgi:hypothetical protein